MHRNVVNVSAGYAVKESTGYSTDTLSTGLVRMPGAFENYKRQQDTFPSTPFRMVYDGLMQTRMARSAAKEYLSGAENGELATRGRGSHRTGESVHL